MTMKHLMERRWFRNIVAYWLSRPPCMMFVVFVLTSGAALLLLGLYVQHWDVLNAGATQNWKGIVESAAKLKFCRGRNSSTTMLRSPNSKNGRYKSSHYETVTIPVRVHMTADAQVGMAMKNASGFAAEVSMTYLGLDRDSPFFQCFIGIVLPGPVSANCTGTTVSEECNYSKGCLSVTVPKHLLSKDMPIGERKCNASSERLIGINAVKPDASTSCDTSTAYAVSVSMSSLNYPTVYLNKAEKDTVHLRLQVASYFLFVLVLSFVLYMALKRSSVAKTMA